MRKCRKIEQYLEDDTNRKEDAWCVLKLIEYANDDTPLERINLKIIIVIPKVCRGWSLVEVHGLGFPLLDRRVLSLGKPWYYRLTSTRKY